MPSPMHVLLCDVDILQKPQQDTWGSGLEAMQTALELEKTVNQCILDMHKLASSHDDAHVSLMMHMCPYSVTFLVDILKKNIL